MKIHNFTTNSISLKLQCCTLAAAFIFASTALPVFAAPTLINSFEPGVGPLVSIAFEPVSGNLFVYPDFSDAILRYTPTGTQVQPDTGFPGTPGNDVDLDFALGPVNIGSATAPTNSLLIFSGDVSPNTLKWRGRYAVAWVTIP